MKLKKRLDVALSELYPQLSRNQLQSWIMQGKASVNGHVITKSGFMVTDKDELSLSIEQPKYVCRAGFKLEYALDYFGINVQNLTILDAGLSTGGFTDCLLQRGARKVYGVDVGYGQVHEKIRSDTRVQVLERTNLRYLTDLGEEHEKVDLITLDLSFISVLKVMEAVTLLLKPQGSLLILIKPQFEAEKHEVGKKGIIKDPEVHEQVITNVTQGVERYGFACQGVIESPITGATGNKEFLAYFKA
ncbi:MAG TPA: TlyA family RNA methyltransferase [Candidatus Babeliaceae bacterium]|nr:TlyA family RNA methyltransferase [Candidatus Babeliaceae bacterium]